MGTSVNSCWEWAIQLCTHNMLASLLLACSLCPLPLPVAYSLIAAAWYTLIRNREVARSAGNYLYS